MPTLRDDVTGAVLELLAASGGEASFGALAHAFGVLGAQPLSVLAQYVDGRCVVLASHPLPQACDDEPLVPDAALDAVLAATGTTSVALPPDSRWRRAAQLPTGPAWLNGVAVHDGTLPHGVLFGVARTPLDDLPPPALAVILQRAAVELAQHREREQRRRLADLYRCASELAGQRVLLHDARGILVALSTGDTGHWPYARDRLLGQHFTASLPPEPAALFAAAHRQVLADGAPWTGEYDIEFATGVRTREMHVARFDAEHTVTVIRDVTESRRTTRALRDSEARLRRLVELAPVGIFWTDPEGAVRYGNPALCRSLALTAAQGLGAAWATYLHPEDRTRVLAAWARLVRGDSAQFDEAYRFTLPDGELRSVRTQAVPIISDGETVAFLGIQIDQTAERRAEAERLLLQTRLQHLQKHEALDQLSGGIAHEFNNLLAGILGYATLALRRLPGDADPRLAAYAQQVIEAGEHGRDLVTRMLAFTQRGGIRGTTTSASAALSAAVGTLEVILPSSIDLTVDVDTGVPAVCGNADDLREVIVNLMLNARDAILAGDPGRQGRLALRLTGPRTLTGYCQTCKSALHGPYVVIEVSDDGCGIEADALERIFDPFYTTRPVGSGTGLGLSVVHGLVHRHGGHVLVESTPCAGACFRVLLTPAPNPTDSAAGA